MTTWLSDPDHAIGLLMAGLALVWLAIAIFAFLLRGEDTITYWLGDQPVSRAEYEHLEEE